MPAIPSQRSDHSSVPDAGTLTIINQILSILCIDVKEKMSTPVPEFYTRTRLIIAAEISRVAAMARNTIGHGLPVMSSSTLKIRACAPAYR